MQHVYVFFLTLLTLLVTNTKDFAQAPTLGSLTNMAMFTSVGAFSNDGISTIIGDIGTNEGSITGFPPGIVDGQLYVENPITLQAAADVLLLYNTLAALPCGVPLGTVLGSNQILIPNVYCLGAASTINGNLYLDGQGDPNATFVFNIDGAFSESSLSKVILINSTSARNVYWRVNGAVDVGAHAIFRGTVVVNGAISLLDGASLLGRGYSKVGAITTDKSKSVRYLSTIHLSTFIEGFYQNTGFMSSTLLNSEVPDVLASMADSITVELRKTTPPYTVMSSSRTIVNTNGTATCDFPITGNFYIALKHRNGLQTWSADTIVLTDVPYTYHFSNNLNNTYGNNQQTISPGLYGIYSGDINQDENIDLIDLSALDNDIHNFVSGYQPSDINGDGNVDLLDVPVLENNVNHFVFSIHP